MRHLNNIINKLKNILALFPYFYGIFLQYLLNNSLLGGTERSNDSIFGAYIRDKDSPVIFTKIVDYNA